MPIAETDTDRGEGDASQRVLPSLFSKTWSFLPWILTVLFGSIALIEAMVIDGPFQVCKSSTDTGSFATGFSTDFSELI